MKYLFTYNPRLKPEFYIETQVLIPEKPPWLEELEEGCVFSEVQIITLDTFEREPCTSNCRHDPCEACYHESYLCG